MPIKQGEERLVGLDELAPGGGVTSVGSVEWILQNVDNKIASNSDQLMWDAIYSCVTSQQNSKRVKDKLCSFDGYGDKWLDFRTFRNHYAVSESNNSGNGGTRSRFIHNKTKASVLEPRLVRQAIHQVFTKADRPKLSLRELKEKISKNYYIHRSKVMNELFSSTRSRNMREKITNEQAKAASHSTSADSSSVCGSYANTNSNYKRKISSSQTLVPLKSNKSSKTTDTSYFSQHDQRVSASVQSEETQGPTETNISSALVILAKSSVQNIENVRDYERKLAEMTVAKERERREKEYAQQLASKDIEIAKLKAKLDLHSDEQAQRHSRLPTAHKRDAIGAHIIRHHLLPILDFFVKNERSFTSYSQATALRDLLPLSKGSMKKTRISDEDITIKSLNYSVASDKQAVNPDDTLIIPSFLKVGPSQAAKALIASLANPDVEHPPPCQICMFKVKKFVRDTTTTREGLITGLLVTLSYKRNEQPFRGSPLTASVSSSSSGSELSLKAGSAVDCPALKEQIGKDQFVTKVGPALGLIQYFSVAGELSGLSFSLEVVYSPNIEASSFFRHLIPNLNQIKITKLCCAATMKGSDAYGMLPFPDESLKALMTHKHLQRLELQRTKITKQQELHLTQFRGEVCFRSCDLDRNARYLHENCSSRSSTSEAPPIKRSKRLARI